MSSQPPPVSGGTLLEQKYRILNKKGEGTFSEVIKCQCIADGSLVAVKRMKGKFHSAEQVNNLREVQALRRLNPHPNIIKLNEVIYDKDKKTLDLACELMEMNIYERIRGRRHHLPESQVKSYVYQLCKALDHMHRNGIFHRDVKPENILIKEDVLKLADFGSCRGIYSKPPFTEYISTRWYRAPECLLTDGFYNFKMDMWSVGCVLFEVMSLYPLFPGSNELDQISKVHDILGTPSAQVLAKIRKNSGHMRYNFPVKQGSGLGKLLPHASAECIDLMNGLLQYDPDLRLSARQALRHPYFKDLRDAEKRQHRQSMAAISKTPASSDAHRRRRQQKRAVGASNSSTSGSGGLVAAAAVSDRRQSGASSSTQSSTNQGGAGAQPRLGLGAGMGNSSGASMVAAQKISLKPHQRKVAPRYKRRAADKAGGPAGKAADSKGLPPILYKNSTAIATGPAHAAAKPAPAAAMGRVGGYHLPQLATKSSVGGGHGHGASSHKYGKY